MHGFAHCSSVLVKHSHHSGAFWKYPPSPTKRFCFHWPSMSTGYWCFFISLKHSPPPSAPHFVKMKQRLRSMALIWIELVRGTSFSLEDCKTCQCFTVSCSALDCISSLLFCNYWMFLQNWAPRGARYERHYSGLTSLSCKEMIDILFLLLPFIPFRL